MRITYELTLEEFEEVKSIIKIFRSMINPEGVDEQNISNKTLFKVLLGAVYNYIGAEKIKDFDYDYLTKLFVTAHGYLAMSTSDFQLATEEEKQSIVHDAFGEAYRFIPQFETEEEPKPVPSENYNAVPVNEYCEGPNEYCEGPNEC